MNQPFLRSNDRYDYLLHITHQHDAEIERITCLPLNRASKRELKQKLINNKESEHGIFGPCVLRQLKYFDVGFSFLSDNLHNIYHGAFVSRIFDTLMYSKQYIFFLQAKTFNSLALKGS